MSSAPKKLVRAKLFGFAQVEKVKSQGEAERVIDRSSGIGVKNGDKTLWSKIGQEN